MELPKLSNLTSAINQHAELLGGVAGAVGVWGPQGFFDNLGSVLSGNVHLPDINMTIKSFFEGKNLDVVKYSAILYIGGEVLGGSYGSIGKKLAKGLLIGNAAQHLLYWTTHANEGSDPFNKNRNSSPSGKNPFEGRYA